MKDQPRFIIHSDGTIEQIIESCEDCISREYILSKAHCCCDDLADDEPCCVDVDDIKNAPSVQTKETYNKGWEDGAKAAAYHFELCIEEIKADIAEFMAKIPALGNCKEGWHNAGQRIGLEQACEIIDNHIAERGTE